MQTYYKELPISTSASFTSSFKQESEFLLLINKLPSIEICKELEGHIYYYLYYYQTNNSGASCKIIKTWLKRGCPL